MSLDKQRRVDQTVARIASRPTKITGTSEILFTSDRKGDPQNLTYASLDKYKVPRYRTSGYGRLLGLDRRFRVVSSSDTKRDVQDEGNDSTRKSRSTPSLTTSIIAEDAPFIGKNTTHEDNAGVIEQRNFIRLDSRHTRKRRKLSASEDDQTTTLYEGLAEEESESEGSSESDASQDAREIHGDDAFEQFRNHPDNIKQIDLTKRTDLHPTDSEAWLALINHQERFFLLSASNDTKALSASARRTIAEIRLSLYERALTKVTASTERRKLLLGYLQEGSNIWDTKTQLKQWKISLKQNASIDLWYRYLDFQQSNPIIFTYEQCLEVYSEVLDKIYDLGDEEKREFHICYWTLRLTTFMYQAGFAERAIAIWQAMLEINFLTLPSLFTEDIISRFEQFWDREVARIGEVNAKGWCANDKNNPEPRADTEVSSLDKSHIFSSWLTEEEARSRDYIMPARTLDDTIEDDPYRVIIFSDIKDYLNSFRTEFGRRGLLQAFLKLCGLPPLSDCTNDHRSWWSDSFLCDYQLLPMREASSPDDSTVRGSFSHFIVDTSTLFPRSAWFSVWNGLELANTALLDFVSRVLAQLVDSRPKDDDLAVYNMAFRFHRESTSARKYAKSLIKRRSERLLLYNAYAFLEARSGNFQAAVKVWSTALSMSRSLDTDVQKQSVFLWHDLVQELFARSEYHQAINVLLAFVTNSDIGTDMLNDKTPVTSHSPSEYLKAEKFYRGRITDALLSHDWRVISAYTSLWSMFRYLTNDHNLSEALLTIDTTVASIHKVNTTRPILESLHQSRAKLIYRHATLSPPGYKPSQLLAPLKESHTLFPNNTILHTLYEHFSRRAGLIDRLRDLNPTTLSPVTTLPDADTDIESRQNTIPSQLLKISLELSRPSYAGTTNHSIRSAFRKAASATATSPATSNPSIWLSWLNWELSLLSPTPSSRSIQFNSTVVHKSIKELYHLSLRSCPWCKQLYLLAFKSDIIRQILGQEELKEIYLSMKERGIRVRVDIEDFFLP